MWRSRPTFKSLTPGNGSQETGGEKEEKEIGTGKLTKSEKTPNKDGAGLRTPVREKVRKLNFRTVESPGKFPAKQAKVSQYYGRKSPRAEKAKEILGQKKAAKANLNIENQGATCCPLLGDTG